jgi:hypothetical protein
MFSMTEAVSRLQDEQNVLVTFRVLGWMENRDGTEAGSRMPRRPSVAVL